MTHTEITLAYPTPVLRRQCEIAAEINPGLKAEILRRAQAPSGVSKSNVGGWHSETDLFQWPLAEVGALLGQVGKATKSMMATTTGVAEVKGELDAWAWANVLYDGGFNTPHQHGDSMWSGVYYVDVGEIRQPDPHGGALEMIDPRCGVEAVKIPGSPFSGGFRISPRDGLMVMFPSWLVHYVRPYRGAIPRISVAFNLRIVGTSLADGVCGGALAYPLKEGETGSE